jgi:sugar/nucleoside kinase (ribokinase family)
MKAVVVGLATQGTILPVEGFPVPYTPARSVPHQITTCVGGAGFTVSRTLAALGDEVCLAAPLGEDAAAAAIDAVAFRYGVSTALCVRTLAHTPRDVILTDPTGRRHVSSDLGDVPSAHLDPASLAEPLRTTDVVLLEDIGLSRPVVAVARAAGVPVMADLHDVAGPLDPDGDELLGVDVLVMSNGRVRGREEDVLLALRERSGARLLVMTLAGDGVLALTPELARPLHLEAYSSGPVTNPDGAGDTFFAALAHFLVSEKHPPVAALRRSAVAVGWVLAHPEEADWLSVEVVEAIVGAAEEVVVEPPRVADGAA